MQIEQYLQAPGMGKQVAYEEKCFTLRVTNKTKPINTAYTIHGQRMEPATYYTPKLKHKQASRQTTADKTLLNTAKYLGIYINSKLSWNHHVNAISKKPTAQCGF